LKKLYQQSVERIFYIQPSVYDKNGADEFGAVE